MIEREINLPTVGLIAGTRVALGMGIGLLVADRLTSEQRQASGWTLVAFGALTTIPLLIEVVTAKEHRRNEYTGPDRPARRFNPERAASPR